MDFNFSLPDNFAKSSPKQNLTLPEGANGLVVHCCCAPCSTSLVECLIFNKIKPLMFFYNPNIYPQEEYEKRRDEWIHLCKLLDIEYVIGDYDYTMWKEKIKGLENEPERGGRCLKCFTHRLTVTAIFAKEKGTTTIAHTNSEAYKDKIDLYLHGTRGKTMTVLKIYQERIRKLYNNPDLNLPYYVPRVSASDVGDLGISESGKIDRTAQNIIAKSKENNKFN